MYTILVSAALFLRTTALFTSPNPSLVALSDCPMHAHMHVHACRKRGLISKQASYASLRAKMVEGVRFAPVPKPLREQLLAADYDQRRLKYACSQA